MSYKEATEDYANKQEKYPIPDISKHFENDEDKFVISLIKRVYAAHQQKQKENVTGSSFTQLCKRIIKKALPDASSDKDSSDVVLA
jgi:hypothetical protein